MFGEHCLRAWSVSQKVVALSSGEAEYYGMVRGASVATGMKGMFGDLGVEVELALYTDASAAIGIAKRRGLGKIRHLELAELWLQDLVNRDLVRVEKYWVKTITATASRSTPTRSRSNRPCIVPTRCMYMADMFSCPS